MTTPRLFLSDQTLAGHQTQADRAWCFSDTQGGLESHDWVLYSDYTAPPGRTVQLGTPLDPGRRYTSRAAWEAALAETGPGSLWPSSGATFVMTSLRSFTSIESTTPGDYTQQVPFRTLPTADAGAATCGGDPRVVPLEIDPGDIYGFDPGTDRDVAAVMREDHDAATVPPAALSAWHEFWLAFPNYEPPSAATAGLLLGGEEGRNGQPRYGGVSEFLAYWQGRLEQAPGGVLFVSSSFALAAPPY